MYMGQLDLFATGNCDFEEEQKEVEEKRKVALEIERRKKERQDVGIKLDGFVRIF